MLCLWCSSCGICCCGVVTSVVFCQYWCCDISGVLLVFVLQHQWCFVSIGVVTSVVICQHWCCDISGVVGVIAHLMIYSSIKESKRCALATDLTKTKTFVLNIFRHVRFPSLTFSTCNFQGEVSDYFLVEPDRALFFPSVDLIRTALTTKTAPNNAAANSNSSKNSKLISDKFEIQVKYIWTLF